MHAQANRFIARFATSADLSVVEIGSRDINGTPRRHFPRARYYGIDAIDGPAVDEVADGATWQPPEPVDLVVCAEVFEHAPNWREIVANAFTMLRPGGRFVATCAGPGRAPHGLDEWTPQPGYYANVSVYEMVDAMRDAGFTAVSVHSLGPDTRGTAVRPCD